MKLTYHFNEYEDGFEYEVDNTEVLEALKELSNEQIVKIYKNLKFPGVAGRILAEIFEYVLEVFIATESETPIMNDEVYSFMREYNSFTFELTDFNLFWGVAHVFSSLGVRGKNKELCQSFLNEVKKHLDQEKQNEILKFHENYRKKQKNSLDDEGR